MGKSNKADKPAKQNKPVNFKAKYIVLGIMIAVLIAVVVLFIVFNNRGQEAKAYMTMETNPQVQVVLGANNKVVGQVALNEGGQEVLAVVDFTGMRAEDAAELFAKVVTEMDKMNGTIDTGKKNKVTVTISAEKSENYKSLETKVKNAVNGYFADNGIYAGAVTKLSDDVKTFAQNMVVDSKELAHMTTQEILDYTKQSSAELEKMSIATRSTVEAKFTELYTSLLATADSIMDEADKVFVEAEVKWAEAEKAYQEQYKNATTEIGKQVIQSTYDAAKDLYNKAVEAYNTQKTEFNTKKAEFQKKLDAEVNKIIESAKADFEKLKAEAKETYKTTKATVENSINEFKKMSATEKENIQKSIKTFQESLAKSA